MFEDACRQIRNATYGLLAASQVTPTEVSASVGTGFTIAADVLVTAGHLLHVDMDLSKPSHEIFEVIRAPDYGQPLETAQFIAEDPKRDIALLRIAKPSSNRVVRLLNDVVPVGTACGSLGFPLATAKFSGDGRNIELIERFQGASISAFYTTTAGGVQYPVYETDALMYKGSSGCPGFLADARVFGVHTHSVDAQPGTAMLKTRLAIALWIPSTDIISFVRANGVEI